MIATEKYALVTGAADRIGKAVALRLAEMGYNIILHYNRSKEKAANTKKEIEALGRKVKLVQIDFSNTDTYYTIFEQLKKEGIAIEILINSASDFKPSSIFEDGNKSLRHFFTINFESAYLLTKVFAKFFEKGQIINFLDTKVEKNETEHLDYLLSKKLLKEFTHLSAMQLGPNIRVNAIAPGLILPPPGKDAEYLDSLRKDNPLQAIGSLEQIQNSMQFLVENPFLNGQIIYVDGGENL